MCIGWKLVEKSDRFAYSQSGKNKLDVRNPAEKTAKASSKKEKGFIFSLWEVYLRPIDVLKRITILYRSSYGKYHFAVCNTIMLP